jgi:hypothetical protein
MKVTRAQATADGAVKRAALENMKNHIFPPDFPLPKTQKQKAQLKSAKPLFCYGGEGEIRPLQVSPHAQPCFGSPTLADAAIPGRFSDIQSALAPLRIFQHDNTKEARQKAGLL